MKNLLQTSLFSYLVFCSLVLAKDNTTTSTTYYAQMPWSVRMAKTRFALHSTKDTTKWDYVSGTTLEGFAQLYQFTGDSATYLPYIKNTIDYIVTSGKIGSNYSYSGYTLDNINEGRMLLLLHQKYGGTYYKMASDTLRKQLSEQSRTTEGGFWHKKTYPNQMWLDGIYMASPFYAEYGKVFTDTAAYTDVVKQISLVTKHTYDTTTNLLYHGWDETKTMAWANKTTGTSKTLWARAMGWYAMAIVDVLDYLPTAHPGRTALITDLQNLAKGLKTYQDAGTGLWYQVVDQGSKALNYHECSASCMFTYALAKGVRNGYLDTTYLPTAKKGYVGILNNFIRMNADSTIQIDSICKSASLVNTTTDTTAGSYSYYVSSTSVTSNEGKGIGPFMMASVEMERIGFVVPPTGLTVTTNAAKTCNTLTWKDKAYNAVAFYVERKKSTAASYTIIKQVGKGVTTVVDTPTATGVYLYRVRAKSDSLYSDYSDIVSATIETAVPVELTSFAATVTNASATLNWKTATEANNYGFDVERRTVGETANGKWEKAGFVAGNGTSAIAHSYSYTDANVSAGTYAYRLKQIDNDGAYIYSSEAEVTIAVPKVFALNQNYPNPFNPSTVICYQLPVAGPVSLKVYDVIGREVATLVNETKEAGSYDVTFNATKLASGVYFYRMNAGSYTSVKKLLVMK
jgi:rhamnogalacturonyl hydrolase YesR